MLFPLSWHQISSHGWLCWDFFPSLKMSFSSSLVNAFCPPLTSVITSFPVCINLPPRPNENLMSLGGMQSYFRVHCDPAAAVAAAESSINSGQVIVTNLHSIHICSLIFNARHCPPRCGSQSLFISVHYLCAPPPSPLAPLDGLVFVYFCALNSH